LPVVLSVDHSSPSFTLTVAYKAGIRQGPIGKSGLPLLVAHLMQQGSANVAPGEHQALVEQTGGVHNYGLMLDLTHFSSNLPASQLEMALFLEADRMRSLEITPAGFQAAHTTVLEQQAGERNRPYSGPLRRMVEMAFPSYKVQNTFGDPEGDTLSQA